MHDHPHNQPRSNQTTPGDLAGQRGPAFWRSLDELASTGQFRQWLEDEFPSRLADWDDYDGPSRRTFLKIMAASFALALLPSCTDTTSEKIVPYVHDPAASDGTRIVPGQPMVFATAITRGYETIGVLATSHQGRPTKLEGNPDHPASLGATDLFTQAQILGLCDPDRSQAIINPKGQISSTDAFKIALQQQLKQPTNTNAKPAKLSNATNTTNTTSDSNLAILTGTMTSPTHLAQLQTLLNQYPGSRWYCHDPVGRANARQGSRLAFGRTMDTLYHFDKASVILSLDADFLTALPGSVRYARDFTDARRVRKNNADHSPPKMNRLYYAEPSPSLTGAKADHRLALQSQHMASLAILIAQEIGVPAAALPQNVTANKLTPSQRHWATICAQDLQSAANQGLVLAGESQPPWVHALMHAINTKLGSPGTAVHYIKPTDRLPDRLPDPVSDQVSDQDNEPQTITDLTKALANNQIHTLIILDTNPAYDAPDAATFTRLLKRVPLSIHLGLYHDETAQTCHWHLPMNHSLESWGDAHCYDGSTSIIQPLINPLYPAHTIGEILTLLVNSDPYDSRASVHNHWRNTMRTQSDAAFEKWWRQTLRLGVIADSQSKLQTPDLQFKQPTSNQTENDSNPSNANATSLTLSLRPCSTLWDGRFANNSWLQEIPDPLTKLTWGNALLISSATAKRLKITQAGGVKITTAQGKTLLVTAYVMPGQADNELTLSLGLGRWRAGQVGNDVGVNAYAFRMRENQWQIADIKAQPTAAPYTLASTQNHQVMEGRDLFRSGTLAAFNHNAHQLAMSHEEKQKLASSPESPVSDPNAVHLTLLTDEHSDPNDPSKPNAQQQWGMSIDLSACIGCNACTIACQAENAIPVVGKDQVEKGRKMHWIRIDRYFEGSPDEPDELAYHHQPVPCMHCEAAPCELVCPVGATQHSEDGLNEMIYNRCIGTRYCSNNCPYKVRRFNFLQYSESSDNTLAIAKNPEVSVRARGVMEKCTYCVQRIRHAQINAHNQGQSTIDDGQIVTACQQVCPTRAITFGDVADKTTQVSQAKSQPHDYAMLAELNTRPRTTYLAEVRNPNPKLHKPGV